MQIRAKSQEPRAKSVKLKLIFLLSSFFFPLLSSAQCAMCRAVLETEDGGQKGEAVNDGIVYLMIFPYLLVGIVAYVIYRMRKKVKTDATSTHQP